MGILEKWNGSINHGHCSVSNIKSLHESSEKSGTKIKLRMTVFLPTKLMVAAAAFSAVASGLYAAAPQVAEGKFLNLGPSLEYFSDPTKELTLDQILDKGQHTFIKHEKQILSLGFQDGAYWLRFALLNPGMQTQDWFLVVDYAFLDDLAFYHPDATTAGGFRTYSGSDLVPFAQRWQKYHGFLFPVTLPPQREQVFYLRVSSQESLQVPLELWNPQEFWEKKRDANIILGLCYGILIIMVIYNLFIFLSLRDISYLYYLLYVGTMTLFLSSYNGIGFEYLWPEWPWWQNHSFAFLAGLLTFLAVQFARSFLNVRPQLPRWDGVLRLCGILGLLVALVALLLAPAWGLKAASVVPPLSGLALLATGTRLIFMGSRPARYFMIAWVLFLVGVLAFVLYVVGVLPRNALTSHGFQIGAVMEVFLLSLGLADRINSMRLEKEEIQEEALRVQKRMTRAFAKFVPNAFLRLLAKSDITHLKPGEATQREMTVFFADIRNFTTLSETMSPSENFAFINAYLRRMSPLISANNGFIDKYIGDAIMALFEGSPGDAIKAGIAMQRALQVYNQERLQNGFSPIANGIGIHTGLLILGTVGDDKRMNSTVISDAVNIAARLEGLTKFLGAGIVASKEALDKCDGAGFQSRFLGWFKVKGRTTAVAVYEVLSGIDPVLDRLKLQTEPDFQAALAFAEAGQRENAIRAFERVLQQNPGDLAAVYHKTARAG